MLGFLQVPKALAADRAGFGIRFVVVSLVFMKLATLTLWKSTRIFPHAPFLGEDFTLPAPLDGILLLAELVLLVWIGVRPSAKKWFPAFFLIFVLWGLTDQTRLQPWYYLYALLLASVFLYRKPSAENSNQPALALQQLVVVGLYVWSGIHKHSYDYYNYVHGFIAGSLEPYLPEFLFGWLSSFSVVAPWFELAAGVFLVLNKTRKLGVFMVCSMHAYLLLCLGPLGSGWNHIIWPWNISMILIVWLLFFGAPATDWRALFSSRAVRIAAPVAVLALVMPALRLVDAWDNNLSFCLYSGKTKGLTIYIREHKKQALPSEARRLFKPTNEPGLLYVDANVWSMDEVGVPVYPEERVYKQVSKELCNRYFGQNEFFAQIKRRPGYVKQGDVYQCDDL